MSEEHQAKLAVLEHAEWVSIHFQIGDTAYNKDAAWLKDYIASLRSSLAESERERERLTRELGEATSEYLLKAQDYGLKLADAQKENSELEESNDALHAKVKSLSAHHGTCSCSYDTLYEVCDHHSPRLVAAQQELAAIQARFEAVSLNAAELGCERDRLTEELAQVKEERDSWATQRLAYIEELESTNAALRAELEKAREENVEAFEYLGRLLRYIYPRVTLLPTLLGRCIQIDNGLAVALKSLQERIAELEGK